MAKVNLKDLNLEKDWKPALRLVTYGRIFHSQGDLDVYYHVRGITQDPNFQMSVQEVIAFSNYALSTTADLGKELFNLKETWDPKIRKFLKELVSELTALNLNEKNSD